MSERAAESDHLANLRALWRELAEKGIEGGVDYPRIVLDLSNHIDVLEQHLAAVEALAAPRPGRRPEEGVDRLVPVSLIRAALAGDQTTVTLGPDGDISTPPGTTTPGVDS
jgi:hypothetical protein